MLSNPSFHHHQNLLQLPLDLRNIKKLPDKVLGAGASGTCYTGIDIESSGRLFAIKEIPLGNSEHDGTDDHHDSKNSNSHKSSSKETVTRRKILTQRLQNEVSLCASIPPHPNIVAYYGSRLGHMITPFAASSTIESNHHDHEHSNTIGGSSSSKSDSNNNHYDCLDIIMELLPGGSVSSILRSLNLIQHHHKNDGSNGNSDNNTQIGFPEKLAKKYTVDLLLGVDHLHNVARIVVRDIKGDNLLLTADGRTAKLVDFGTARRRYAASHEHNNQNVNYDDNNNHHQTASKTTMMTMRSISSSSATTAETSATTNTTSARKSLLFYTQVGTSSYIAPEVANAEYNGDEDENEDDNDDENDNTKNRNKNKNKAYTSRADIWSIGCCVFEFLTGAPPCYGIDSSNQFAIFFAIATNDDLVPDMNNPTHVPNENVRSSISQDAKDFVMNCCCVRDPRKRKSVRELLRHPWVREEVEYRVEELKKKEASCSSSRNYQASSSPSSAVLTTLTSVLSIQSGRSNDDDTTAAFGEGKTSATTTSSGEGLMLPNGAFVDF